MNKAYLIHTRDFRETSLLIDFFTQEHGFIRAVARGVRSNRKHNKRGLLQLFTPLLIDWRGNSDLVSLTSFELADQPFRFSRKNLSVAFYINELLYYLLNKYTGITIEGLFDNYENILKNIYTYNKYDSETNTDIKLEILLREFELDLLESIGYGLQFECIEPDDEYAYSFEDGFYRVSSESSRGFNGSILMDINKRNWHSKKVLFTAKVLLRQIIQYHIGDKELNSRKLFFVD